MDTCCGNGSAEETAQMDLKSTIRGGVIQRDSVLSLPLILKIDISKHDDGVIYNGKIVVKITEGATLDSRVIEQELLKLKHCFQCESKDVPAWMNKMCHDGSSERNRMSITYIVSKTKDQLTVDFYRSMAKGVCGAHRLHKVTAENDDNWQYSWAWHSGEKYYTVPLGTCEANRLMNLFGTMAVEVIERYFAEQFSAQEAKIEYLKS